MSVEKWPPHGTFVRWLDKDQWDQNNYPLWMVIGENTELAQPILESRANAAIYDHSMSMHDRCIVSMCLEGDAQPKAAKDHGWRTPKLSEITICKVVSYEPKD